MNRRQVLLTVPALVISPLGYTAVTRPDQVYPDLWAEPRVVRLLNANTGRHGEFCYWRDGDWNMPEYIGLSALLLDHREGQAVQLQPALFDLMFASQRWYEMAQGKKTKTIVTSGYRTPRTNALVGGVPGGRHPQAAALDGWLENVSLSVYAQMLKAFGAGGVGLYARHVHWDVGRPPAFWHGSYKES